LTKLLYLEASPRGANSYSSRVAAAFLDEYRKTNPDHEIEHLPLFGFELPRFSAEGANQKMANIMDLFQGGEGIAATGEWAGVIAEIERLESADKVLLSSPMWNYSVPFRLKHWIDLVVQVGASVLVNERGEYIGQITGRPLQMIIASGSPYEERFPLESDGTKIDFMTPYLNHIFRFLGFEDIRTLRVMPTGIPTPETETMVEKREEEARAAARAF
jgi:FMN-dependent NADH-azoreductase